MKSNFERCLALVLVHEGGWADHPKDPGGATMRGVTLATFRAYYGKDATKDDLRRITDAQLASIYRRGYWQKVGCDTLASGVDLATFDFAVNSGPARAREYLLKSIGGPDATTINRLCDSRLAYMQRIKGKDGKLLWPTFGKGWTRRVEGVRAEALRMAGRPAVPANTESAPAKPAVPRKPAPKGLLGAILAVIAAVVGVIGKKQGWW